MLATLPGLPMFGHGQVEGFSEKYGMEFRRPKWEETQDDGLIQAHEWRIFPLLHRRFLFADVEHFLLFDLYQSNGSVDENVFAYTNRFGDERGLVIYHNVYGDTKGWIKTSSASLDKGSGKLKRRNLAEGLGLPREGFVIFKDYASQLEYIRSCKEIWDKGMYVELSAYQCHAFMDFRFVGDKEWGDIYHDLNGAGVPSMQAEWTKRFATVEEAIEEKPAKKKRAPRKAVTKKTGVKAKAVKKTAKKSPVSKTKAAQKPVTKKAQTKTSLKKQAVKRTPKVTKPASKPTTSKVKSSEKAKKDGKSKTDTKKPAAVEKVKLPATKKPASKPVAPKTGRKKSK
ncbi:MAG TPA: hypothetical protein PK414_14400 [Anaerolineales bacterium]|nr:hypothetical protein [Anaerolineales bacterium]